MNIQISCRTSAQARRKNKDAHNERRRTMHWTRMLAMFTLLTIMITALAACGGAPQAATNTSAPAAATSAATPAP